jgi:hypothetical protein
MKKNQKQKSRDTVPSKVPSVRFSIAGIFMNFTPLSLSGLVTLGLKYKLVTLNFGEGRHHLILMHTLSVHISS